ncbi:MAG: zinc-dependent alcohol dehydrogenase [Bryobacteraceae bacterium]
MLIRVRAVGICGTDIHILRGDFPRASPPLVLGHEISGEVHTIGARVSRLKPGDRVTIDSVVGCGNCHFCLQGSPQFCPSGYEFGINRDGGCQDFLVVPEANAFLISNAISFEEGAILDMEMYAALARCSAADGVSALVVGDGPAGLIACQLLRHMGAGKVILSGQSAARMTKANELTLADRVIDARYENVGHTIEEETKIGVDIAVDCAGTPESARQALGAVRAGGVVLLYAVYRQLLENFDLNNIVLRDLRVFGALSDRQGWESVIALAETGRLQLRSLITHRFALEQAKLAFDSVKDGRDGLVKAVFIL